MRSLRIKPFLTHIENKFFAFFSKGISNNIDLYKKYDTNNRKNKQRKKGKDAHRDDYVLLSFFL